MVSELSSLWVATAVRIHSSTSSLPYQALLLDYFTSLFTALTGFIAMYATLASRDVDCCLIPESPFYLEGEGGLFEYIEKRLKESGHMVLVIAEGAGQDLMSKSMESMTLKDASGNKLLKDVGLWLSQSIKVNHKLQRQHQTLMHRKIRLNSPTTKFWFYSVVGSF